METPAAPKGDRGSVIGAPNRRHRNAPRTRIPNSADRHACAVVDSGTMPGTCKNTFREIGTLAAGNMDTAPLASRRGPGALLIGAWAAASIQVLSRRVDRQDCSASLTVALAPSRRRATR